MTIISPGSTSRTTLAPIVASAACSLATTQPRSRRPSTSGRILRVAGGVQRALVHPDERERAAQLRQHLERPLLQRGVRVAANSAVTSPVSFVEASWFLACSSSSSRTRQVGDHAAQPWVLIRLPLWPSAMEPSAVGRNVGLAFSQVLAPVVE